VYSILSYFKLKSDSSLVLLFSLLGNGGSAEVNFRLPSVITQEVTYIAIVAIEVIITAMLLLGIGKRFADDTYSSGGGIYRITTLSRDGSGSGSRSRG
jgi:hypothetical protein